MKLDDNIYLVSYGLIGSQNEVSCWNALYKSKIEKTFFLANIFFEFFSRNFLFCKFQ